MNVQPTHSPLPHSVCLFSSNKVASLFFSPTNTANISRPRAQSAYVDRLTEMSEFYFKKDPNPIGPVVQPLEPSQVGVS